MQETKIDYLKDKVMIAQFGAHEEEFTLLENAKVKIVKIPGLANCRSCGNEFKIENFFDPCAKCGAYNPDIISGKELRVKSLNID